MRRVDRTKRFVATGVGMVIGVVALTAASASADLVGYWKLNETAGTTAYDSSGNGRHGEVLGENEGPLASSPYTFGPPDPGPEWNPSGMFDGAISLDGHNDRIRVLDHQDLKYTGGNLTLSTWFYRNEDDTTTGYPISKPWNGSGRYNYWLRVDGEVNTRVAFQLANAYTTTPPGQSITITSPYYESFREQWNHVAAVVDSDNKMTLYVNGLLAASGTNPIDDWVGTDSNVRLSLGTYYPYAPNMGSRTTHAFNGKLDDVAIFNDALDPAQIMSIYNVPTTLGLAYDLGDMMSLWSIFDAGPGGFGVVDGMPWWYADQLPGTPPAPGGAYVHDDIMYLVLGSGVGLRTPEPSSLIMAILAFMLLVPCRSRRTG